MKKIVPLLLMLLVNINSFSLAGIPVLDAATELQTTISALENVAQTLKQIEEYNTQLDQYMKQLENSISLDQIDYLWRNAETTIQKLQALANTLEYYQSQLGGIDEFLKQYEDLDYYETLCKNTDCNWADMAFEDQKKGTEARKKANDSLFKALEYQQAAIINDAKTLSNLQTKAQDAVGHMQALQYSNQLAANQSSQLLQLRQIISAQQVAQASLMQHQVNQEARTTAADREALRKGYSEKKVEDNPKDWSF